MVKAISIVNFDENDWKKTKNEMIFHCLGRTIDSKGFPFSFRRCDAQHVLYYIATQLFC